MKRIIFTIVFFTILCVANVTLATLSSTNGVLNSIAGALCGVVIGLNVSDLVNKNY